MYVKGKEERDIRLLSVKASLTVNDSKDSFESKKQFYTNSSGEITYGIQNVGNVNLGNDCKLSLYGGDANLYLNDYKIPDLKPNQIGHIWIRFRAFNIPGIYNTQFQLSYHGTRFGDILPVDIEGTHIFFFLFFSFFGFLPFFLKILFFFIFLFFLAFFV